MAKDDAEIALLRLAAEAADRVIGQVSHGPLIGRTEAEVSREIRERLVTEGHELAEFAIVGSGPNTASPHLYAARREAQGAASAAVRPGIACQALDATARSIITAAGYGPQFFHRLGHGIGLEAHEDPYLVEGNPEPLRPGYAFSVEPGIYFEGRYGARLEDIVVSGSSGSPAPNRSPLDLQVVDGR
jgi:Xaa-Pro dipeptidase